MVQLIKKIAYAVATIALSFGYMWAVIAIEGDYAKEMVRVPIFFFLVIGFIVYCARYWKNHASDVVSNSHLFKVYILQYPILLAIGFELIFAIQFSIVFQCILAAIYGGYISHLWVKHDGFKRLIRRR